MKVCASLHLSPYQRSHKRFDSLKECRAWLWNYLYREGMLGPYDKENPSEIMLYPQCSECNNVMCFHDYPFAKFSVGPRGGINYTRKV